MAHHKSAIKRIRSTAARRERNRSARSKVRTTVKAARTNLAEGKAGDVIQEMPKIMKTLHKAASSGLMNKKTASRRIGRLAKAAHRAASEG